MNREQLSLTFNIATNIVHRSFTEKIPRQYKQSSVKELEQKKVTSK